MVLPSLHLYMRGQKRGIPSSNRNFSFGRGGSKVLGFFCDGAIQMAHCQTKRKKDLGGTPYIINTNHSSQVRKRNTQICCYMQQRVTALHLQNSHTLCTKKDHVLDILIIAWSLCLSLSLPYVYIQLFLCMYNQAAIQKLMVFAALVYRQNFKLMYCLQISDIFSLVWCFYIEVTWSYWRSSGLCTWVNEQVLFFFLSPHHHLCHLVQSLTGKKILIPIFH